MKGKVVILAGVILFSFQSYSAIETNSIFKNIESIEEEYDLLIQKEKEVKEKYISQKKQLEKEVEDLKKIYEGKNDIEEKLKKDSEVRWHRDEYKKVLNSYNKYYKNIEKNISNKENKIFEIDTILSIVN